MLGWCAPSFLAHLTVELIAYYDRSNLRGKQLVQGRVHHSVEVKAAGCWSPYVHSQEAEDGGGTSFTPSFGRQRQVDLCESETSLVYKVSSKTGRV